MIETKSPEKVHYEISKMLSNGVSYIDALVEYAKQNNIEIETVAEIVKKSTIMKEKVRSEAAEKRMVKKDKNANRIC